MTNDDDQAQRHTVKHLRLSPFGVAAIVAIGCAVALLLWPITLQSTAEQSAPRSLTCGNAIQQGPVYDVLSGSGGARLRFLSIEQYQPIAECNGLRLRNRILGIGALVVSASIVITGVARSRRVGG